MATASASGKPSKSLLPQGLSDSDTAQLHVLKALFEASPNGDTKLCLDIDEVALKSGLRDERETLRCLYILEGQKLVTPFPLGDLTSKKWCVTQVGAKAAKKFGL